MEPNIVGEIPKDCAPRTAEFALMNPTGEFIEAFYRTEEVKLNDGTTATRFSYWSSFDNWQPSVASKRYLFDPERKFKKIV